MDKKIGLFELLGPGKSFALGIVMAFLAIFSIGFFILLFSDSGISLGDSNGDKKLAEFNQPADNGAPQPSQKINISDITNADHIRGDINKAEVIVVEFSDIDCPFCARFHPIMKQVVDDYNGKVAWVYRHFPLDSLHPKARTKAEASECVAELGGNDAFWTFIDELYVDSEDNLQAIAETAGVNVADFNDCVDDKRFAAKVQSQYQDAVSSGGRGTPYSVAVTKDGQKVPISGALPLAQVKAVIDPLIK